MDTFFEQIIKIKKTPKTFLGYAMITLVALILIATAWLFLKELAIIVAAGAVWGAFKFYAMLDIEYEYIITNSSFDIDKIIAKNSRKRILSFDITAIERIENYRADMPKDIIDDAVIACNGTEEDAVVLVIHPEGKQKKTVIIAPEQRMRDAIKKFLPKYIGENF